ncbi:MAG: hypothetical protein ACR2HR_17825 [Euzebya sp.]
MATETEVQLNDDALDKGTGVIGPISLKFVGRWDRVERALDGLPHDPVRFRWTTDSTDEMALFIEIPVREAPDADTLITFRDRLRESLNEVEGDRQVYIHFLDASTSEDPAGAADGDA